MLVLTVKDSEPIRIGKNIIVRVKRRSHNGRRTNELRLVIDAPKELKILRENIEEE